MKKALLFVGIVALIFWANTHKNELAVWFNSDDFPRREFSTCPIEVFL
jgi:hypothetical protein